MQAMVEVALSYARRGWAVLPLHALLADGCSCLKPECTSVAKHPRSDGRLLPHGVHSASKDETTIRAWWERWPNANIGLAMGGPSGLVALDVDPAHGGEESLAQLLAEVGPLPATMTSLTGGGGRHLFFRPQCRLANSVGTLGAGLDVKSDGGYVVAPPSMHRSGRPYAWLAGHGPGEVDIAPAPDWLGTGARGQGAGVNRQSSIVNGAQRSALSTQHCIPEGERNTTLFGLAARLRRGGLSAEAVAAAVHAHNAATCQPPLAQAEVERLVASALRGGSDSPQSSLLYREEVMDGRILRFYSAVEVAAQTSTTVPWVAYPWLARGALTEVIGKAKLAGKTTFMLALCRAVVTGAPFLDGPTARTRVIYLTEQSESSFVQGLDEASLLDHPDFVVLFWRETIGVPWPDVVAQVVAEAERREAGLVVVDTLPQFAGLHGDEENSAGAVLKALQPLQAAAQRGLAVAVIRHERKSGGEIGDAGRGSSAFAGAMDVCMTLRRPDGGASPRRQIAAVSRYRETPEALSIEKTERGFIAHLDTESLALRLQLEKLLPHLPPSEAEGVTVDALLAATDMTRTLAYNTLQAARVQGTVGVVGRGVKGDPHRYYRIHPSTTSSL